MNESSITAVISRIVVGCRRGRHCSLIVVGLLLWVVIPIQMNAQGNGVWTDELLGLEVFHTGRTFSAHVPNDSTIYLIGSGVWIHDSMYSYGILKINTNDSTVEMINQSISGEFRNLGNQGDTLYLSVYSENSTDSTSDGGQRIVVYDGSGSWDTIGSVNGYVYDLMVVDSTLYVAGLFDSIGAGPFNNIATWNGSSWQALGSGVAGVVFGLYSIGDSVIVTGRLDSVDGAKSGSLAIWTDSTWSSLDTNLSGSVLSFGVYKDSMFLGGKMSIPALDSNVVYLASYYNGSWSKAIGDPNGDVRSIIVDTSGMVFAGSFSAVNGDSTMSRIAIYDTTAHSLGSGIQRGVVNQVMYSGSGLLSVGAFSPDSLTDGIDPRCINRFDPNGSSAKSAHTFRGKWIDIAPSRIMNQDIHLVLVSIYNGDTLVREEEFQLRSGEYQIEGLSVGVANATRVVVRDVARDIVLMEMEL